MESRDIYNLTRKTIEWENNWIHIGIGEQVKKAEFELLVNEHFENDSMIFLKRGRLNSEQIEIKSMFDKTIELIGNEDFELWSKDFKKAIKFNKIGVLLKSRNLSR